MSLVVYGESKNLQWNTPKKKVFPCISYEGNNYVSGLRRQIVPPKVQSFLQLGNMPIQVYLFYISFDILRAFSSDCVLDAKHLFPFCYGRFDTLV